MQKNAQIRRRKLIFKKKKKKKKKKTQSADVHAQQATLSLQWKQQRGR